MRSGAATRARRGDLAMTRLQYVEAADHYLAAAERLPETDFQDWFVYRLRYAGALYSQGDEFGQNDSLQAAIEAHRTTLAQTGRADHPLDWAMTQDNLGTALGTLGGRESGTARVEESVAAFRAALEERARERVPLDWAATQNNLGKALRTLGERESATARLEESVAAYRAALEEWTRERVPLQWAMMRIPAKVTGHSGDRDRFAHRRGAGGVLA
jgi:tetratricopeptide (TPR) repeat protein